MVDDNVKRSDEAIAAALKKVLVNYDLNNSVLELGLNKAELTSFIQSMTSNPEFQIKKGQEENVLYVGIYNVLNGPVGLNKTTKYPRVNEETSIRNLMEKVNKTGWTKFLNVIKSTLTTNNVDVSCKMMNDYKEYYPCADFKSKN